MCAKLMSVLVCKPWINPNNCNHASTAAESGALLSRVNLSALLVLDSTPDGVQNRKVLSKKTGGPSNMNMDNHASVTMAIKYIALNPRKAYLDR